MAKGIDVDRLRNWQIESNNRNDWKEYEARMRKAVDEKMKQRDEKGLDTSGNLSNEITTKMNIGATKESTITGAGQELSKEMNEALGENTVSYTHTTSPFSVSFNGDETDGIFMKIIKFFLRIFGLFGSGSGQEMNGYPGEIQLDRDKEYQIVGINKDLHSTAVIVDNVNKLVVGYDPNGNFKPSSFYSLLTQEDRAYLANNGYTFVNANSENKNKGTITGMCGVLTTDWIEQELKTKLDERKMGITKYNSAQEIRDHYALVNQRNNPNVDRMMARNRVHFLMSKGDNIETLKEYDEKINMQQQNAQSNKTSSGMMFGNIKSVGSDEHYSSNVVRAKLGNSPNISL